MRHTARRNLLAAALTAGLLLFSTHAAAMTDGQRSRLQAAYQQQNYRAALNILRPLAKQGDAAAQNGLGEMYADGLGVTQNFKRAVAWYRKAVNQNHAQAQYNLGTMHANGLGVTQSFKRARYWYQKAAAQGNRDAKAALKKLDKTGQ